MGGGSGAEGGERPSLGLDFGVKSRVALLANGGSPPAVRLEFLLRGGTEEASVRRGYAQLCPAWGVLQAWD